LVEIICRINDLLKQDFDWIIEQEIEYNYLLELDHVYEIQWISDHDPNYIKRKKVNCFMNMKDVGYHESGHIALLGTFFG
jgi:hypothetical protein